MSSPASELPDVHPVLGQLEYDEDRRDYSGALTTRGQKVPFRLSRDDDGKFKTAENRAIRFARDPQTEIEAAKRFLAGNYLDLANEQWLPAANRPRLSVRAFIEAIGLEEAEFNGDGGVSFTFADGDVFAGHWLIAHARADGVLAHHELAG
jgi:hypothetical protein